MPGCRKGEKYYDNTEYKRAERKNNGSLLPTFTRRRQRRRKQLHIQPKRNLIGVCKAERIFASAVLYRNVNMNFDTIWLFLYILIFPTLGRVHFLCEGFIFGEGFKWQKKALHRKRSALWITFWFPYRSWKWSGCRLWCKPSRSRSCCTKAHR